ncbi:MAG TPA: hypothetical protein VGB04_10130 [Allosphingosinicella sp.]
MRLVTIAALAAAQLPVAAQSAELPREERTRQAPGAAADTSVRISGEEEALRAVSAAESPQAAAAREDRPRKRKSTGDKILTGAAVVLGIGALAVGGLLVAIFVG